VFAGIAFGIEAPINVGDRISLGDKIEGTVVQMNWRSIRIRTDGDDVAIVPNSVVAKSDIVNRSFPTRVRSALIELSCPATSNPERVIDTLQQAILLCPTILPVPLSSAVLTRLGSTKSRYRVEFFGPLILNTFRQPRTYCCGLQGGNFTTPVSTFRALRKIFEQPTTVWAGRLTQRCRFFKTWSFSKPWSRSNWPN